MLRSAKERRVFEPPPKTSASAARFGSLGGHSNARQHLIFALSRGEHRQRFNTRRFLFTPDFATLKPFVSKRVIWMLCRPAIQSRMVAKMRQRNWFRFPSTLPTVQSPERFRLLLRRIATMAHLFEQAPDDSLAWRFIRWI